MNKHFETEWQTRDGATLSAQCWEPGQKSAAVICLVHGLGEHIGRYGHLAEFLADHGFTFIGNDLRGHGKTPGQRGYVPAFETFMQDIDLLLDQAGSLNPGVPKFLYGHSMGGILVLNYCLRRNPSLAGVVVTSPGMRNALVEQTAKIVFVRLAGAILPRVSLPTGMDASALSRNPEVVRAYLEDPLVHDRSTLRMAKELLPAIPYIFENAAEFQYPLLLMHGSADRLAYASGSQEFVERATRADITYKQWDDAYHELHNDFVQNKVFDYLLAWLQNRL